MHTDVLTNCLISFGLPRNPTPQTISKLDEQEEQHHDDDEVSRTKFIQDGPDSEWSDSGDNNDRTEKQTNKKVPSFTDSLAVLCHPVTVWMMRIQHFVKFMMLLIISATIECSFSPSQEDEDSYLFVNDSGDLNLCLQW